MRGRWWTGALAALIVAGACSTDGSSKAGPFGDGNPLAPASDAEIAEALDAFRPGEDPSHVEQSAVDSLSERRRSELRATETLLGGALPSPDGFGSFRLAAFNVDDPNGDGRIGEFWYAPRVLRRECSAKVDAAPGPFAAANYVPGAGELGETDPMSGFALMESPIVVGVQVQVFDEAAQRDAWLETTTEFFRDPTFPCGGKESSVQTYRETELRTERADVLVFEDDTAWFGGGVTAFTAVGDRILLTLSVGNDGVEPPWRPEDLDRWLVPVLDVALDRLAVAELP